MSREFNVTGPCIPKKNYMVNTNEKLKKIVEMINDEQYFVINLPRQYGKTTTLYCLKQLLKDEYIVISISFMMLGIDGSKGEKSFCLNFMELVKESLEHSNVSDEYREAWFNEDVTGFLKLGFHIDNMCKDKKVVLLVDSVDYCMGNIAFLEFLSMLRAKFLRRQMKESYTFHSVIFAGVNNIKYIKLNEEDYNSRSPWNIASDFNVDMSFNSKEIESMLKDYQSETNVNMDTELISNKIYEYTSGYPYFVSDICKTIDEKLDRDWSVAGILKAVKIIAFDSTYLTHELCTYLEIYKELYDFMYSILINGRYESFDWANPNVDFCTTYGYVKKGKDRNRTVVSNKIFEISLCRYFVSKYQTNWDIDNKIHSPYVPSEDVLKDNLFSMELVLSKFAECYEEIIDEVDFSFMEKYGKMMFFSYLTPLIYCLGFYHIESQFTGYRQMVLSIDFGMEQYVMGLELWKDEIDKERAYERFLGYMDTLKAEKGYLLIFDFRKRKKKEQETKWIQIGDKKIYSILV